MADRRPAKPARRSGASPHGKDSASAPRGGTPGRIQADGKEPASAPRRGTPDAPLVDLIFPNREQPRERGFEPTAAQLDRAAGFGVPERDGFQHRKVGRLARLFGRANTRRRSARAISGITDRPVRRRRVLLGVGTGVVVASGVGGAAALLTGAFGSDSADPNKLNTAAGLGAAGLADSPSDAARIAASATPVYPTPLGRDPELHLLRRATFGPTLIDVVAVKQMGVDAWLERQFNPPTIADPSADQMLAAYPTITMTTAQIRAAVKDGDYEAMYQLGHSTLARQMWSTRQLFEVMVDFWANHLNITNPFDGGWDTRGPYDNEVIRKNALGRYSDMLFASATHPAMMRYLDNASSNKKSVNENYGRELLELHTVGVEAKYSEVDVRQSAYIMTGRTVDRNSNFTYDKNRHWTGPVKVLGFSHANAKAAEGMAVGDLYLTYLATHPNTARRIAYKLGQRFVCDDPPTTLVDRLAQSYLDNGTAIIPVLRTLFSSVEFWMSNGLKTRRPLENVVATARILGVTPGAKTADGIEGLYQMTERMGMAPLRWDPPNGYPDVADYWGSAYSMLGTWNSHRTLVLGRNKGVTYPKSDTFVGVKPDTYGQYLDTISQRLVHQPMLPAHKEALLKFLGAKESTAVKDNKLGGRIDQLVPLILDSVYHALR